MDTNAIRFFFRGQVVSVADAVPTRTVLDWLREDGGYTGTKEGCNEGDCGACTVVIGELADTTTDTEGDADHTIGGLRLRTANACIKFLPSLHGKALFTIEDLKRPDGTLHPAQQAMVDTHGSQCGFCTPGFVMSLWSTYESHQADGTRPSRQEITDNLAGNLCRCTGYRPILDAGEAMFDLPSVRFDTAPIVAALTELRPGATLTFGHTDGPAFHAPTSLHELAQLRLQLPDATLLAGGTDIGLWANKAMRDLGDIIFLGDVTELRAITTTGSELRIGAGASLEDAWRALSRQWPALSEMWLRFASPPVRNAGTMGGNVANGSPIGDSAPVLISLDGSVELRRGDRVRTMLLTEFYVDYMKNQLEPGELLQTIVVPLPSEPFILRAYKLSKRHDCDISSVSAALRIELDGETVRQVRFAFGGMAAIVKRAAHTEAAVVGRPWTEETLRSAQHALTEDFTPLTDMRASAQYRMLGAQNLLRRFWLETRPVDPLPPEAASVWAIPELDTH